MSKKKILFQSNAPWMKTGLAENGRILMNWLAKRGKYDLVYYCTQTMQNDPNLLRMPYKCYGCIPSNPAELNQLNQDPGRARDVAYGSRFIDEIVKNEKPDIWLGSDDIWSFGSNYYKAPWFNKINSIFHITIDSVPILEQAYEQAAATKNYFSWAGFAPKEMKKRGATFDHVKFIYGASDTNKFKPIDPAHRLHLRKIFNIDPKACIFIYLGRNQLRKEFGNVIQAFAQFKKDFPHANAKLLFHTSYSESASGWDIPKLQKYFGLKSDDILCTMFCRNCGAWEVKPYDGEDKDCRFCGAQKSQITVNIANGVSDEELHMVYGLADASVSAFTSGGLEFHNVNSLLCGLPLACTNYSCGEDFCDQPFIYPIKWNSRHETHTNFIKAANDVSSIKNFMSKIFKMSAQERTELGLKGRNWAASEFSIETIGRRWEEVFDAMPKIDWSSITLETKVKNPAYPYKDISDPALWIKDLYKNVLLMDINDDDEGLKHWLMQLNNKMPRENIYKYFIQVAQQENSKNVKPMDFGELFDKNGRKRLLFVMKESGGDIFISTALFENLKKLYPDADMYVATDPKYFDIIDGNEHIHKLLPYHPAMEQELAMIQYVDYYYYPAIPTQKILGYLGKDRIGVEL